MSDYEQLYRDLRGHIEYFLSERKYWNRPEDIKGYFENTLASSAPATASEGATEGRCTNGTACLGGWGPGCCAWPATGVTSSDGDRGLSEEERDWYFRGVAESYKDDEDWGDVMRHVLDLQERLAARTAQPEGVERVEWGVLVGDDDPDYAKRPDAPPMRFVDRENAVLAARRVAGRTLVRRTVTEYAPVTGPWEVVGDE